MKTAFMFDSRAAAHPAGMADNAALIAHVLRRMTFGPLPGQVAAFGNTAPADVIRQVLDAAPPDVALPELGTNDDYDLLTHWWAGVMADEQSASLSGLHERMVWFWHGHLTSSLEKASPAQMLRQHRLLRTHALGNFRQLMQSITTDSAMLVWLDGAESVSSAPNENYAREAMELFTLGRGAYTEADVRAAALALSGYEIDDHGNTVRFDPANGPTRTVTLLGKQVGSAAEAIDVICDNPACAPFVATQLHTFFVGVAPSDARRAELAGVFTSAKLEIRPLVEAIVTHPSFLEGRMNRPRTGIEWWAAISHLFDTEIDSWVATLLGQTPFDPPNVAGWPGNERWLSAGAVFTKAQVAGDAAWDVPTLDDDDPVADVLARAGLYEVSTETIDALRQASASADGRRNRATILHALVAVSPEFTLA